MTSPSIKFRPVYLASLFAACALSPLSGYAGSSDPLGYRATPAGEVRETPVIERHGMVVSAQSLATKAGIEILKAGGNAVDAAVAVGYALAVVYPGAGNVGGGGFATIHLPDGTSTFVDFREHAPAAASATMYLDKSGAVIPDASTEGWRAVAVPGSVRGLNALEERWGKLTLKQVMAPAIRLAKLGYTLESNDVDLLKTSTAQFAKDKDARRIFLNPDGSAHEVGDLLVQKDLAGTLTRIAESGDRGFYEGPVADKIVAASQRGGGILTKADLRNYAVRFMKPLQCAYHGYQIETAPPPSGGGAAICEVLNILSGDDIGKLGLRSVAGVRLQVEAMRHAYSDRRDLGDPRFVENPIAHLSDANYAKQVRQGLNGARAIASSALMPGDALPHAPRAMPLTPAAEQRQTTQISTADKSGYAVSLTYTLNGWFGAHVVAGHTGILMNDEMDDFSKKPGVPNMYGIVGSRANEIAPGKTPLSSMSPTIVSKDKSVVMVIGSPGGSRIPTIILNVMLGVMNGGMDIQQAVNMPRIHEQWMPTTLEVEPNAISSEVMSTLRSEGYEIAVRPQSWGIAQGILLGRPRLGAKPTGLFYGGSDQRHPGGLAEGF